MIKTDKERTDEFVRVMTFHLTPRQLEALAKSVDQIATNGWGFVHMGWANGHPASLRIERTLQWYHDCEDK
jgi:hypothetical protein